MLNDKTRMQNPVDNGNYGKYNPISSTTTRRFMGVLTKVLQRNRTNSIDR